MNIKLSVYTSRTKGLSGYLVSKAGSIVDLKVSKLSSQNMKEDMLEKLARGLRACRGSVSHEDILYIEIQNRHLCDWLEGKEEYKGYSAGLDTVFEVLESLDCRYKFVFVKKPTVEQYLKDGKTELDTKPALEVFAELE